MYFKNTTGYPVPKLSITLDPITSPKFAPSLGPHIVQACYGVW